jgi:hypothetical protein
MFERITFRQQNKSSKDSPLDIGLLLESMLFYKKTIIASHSVILKQLVKTFGFNELNELLDRGILEIIYAETTTAIRTETMSDGLELHDTFIISSPQHTFPIDVRKICIEETGKQGKGRRNAERLSRKITVSNHDGSLAESARQLLLDNSFLKKSVPKLLLGWIPEAKDLGDIQFQTEKVEKGIVVSTNLDFKKLNEIYHRRISPSYSSITPAHILSNLYDIEIDLYYASRNLSEIASSNITSKLIDLRITHLANRCSKSNSEKDSFQNLVFCNQKTIREAYNQGQIELKEILKAIYNADRFKDWLVKQSIDSNLLNEYCREVTKNSNIDKLSSKIIRWSLFTGAGLIGEVLLPTGLATGAGLSLSVLDGFFLDKLIKGWKPNQFVEEYLFGIIKEET